MLDDKQAFSKRLRKLMRTRRMTVQGLAAHTGVSRNTIYGWLRGDQLPQTYYLKHLRRAFECEWEDLLGF